jgi:polyhydroxybutyrate depolymerase
MTLNSLSIGVLILLSLSDMQATGTSRTIERSIKSGGLYRVYYLHVPSSQGPYPLVLVFHGGGGTPEYTERESKFSQLSDKEGFLVAYPQGYRRSWNDGRGDMHSPAQRDSVDDLGFIKALLDDVESNFDVDPKRIYSTGISNGGVFSHYLATNMSSRIAAIAPVSAGYPVTVRDQFHPTAPVSVLMIQSADDPLVPYNGGDIHLPIVPDRVGVVPTDDAVRMWVTHDGTDLTPMVVDLPDTHPDDGCREQKFTYRGGTGGSEVVLIKITGGGHTWPGGNQYLSSRIVGVVCRDFNATDVIWEFFKNHPKQ